MYVWHLDDNMVVWDGMLQWLVFSCWAESRHLHGNILLFLDLWNYVRLAVVLVVVALECQLLLETLVGLPHHHRISADRAKQAIIKTINVRFRWVNFRRSWEYDLRSIEVGSGVSSFPISISKLTLATTTVVSLIACIKTPRESVPTAKTTHNATKMNDKCTYNDMSRAFL